MMEQKATVEFDGRTNLTISGELLPALPGVHDALAALLDEKNPPVVDVEFRNENNVLTYSLSFSRPAAVLEPEKSE